MAWFGAIEHERWLSSQMRAVLDHGHKAYLPGGFGYIGPASIVDPRRPLELALTARSTYVYALGTLMGIPGSRRRCDHGVLALRKYFYDDQYGGWFTSIESPTLDEVKNGHTGVPSQPWGERKDSRSISYVLQAAAAATAANRPGANELLAKAIEISKTYFWDEQRGRVNDSFDREFKQMETYHGMSSNLRAAEAYLVVADVLGDKQWVEHSARIVEFAIAQAKENDWRVPEHFNENWQVQKDYNVGHPADPRRPYGINIGHCLAWSRIILQTRAALKRAGLPTPEGMLEAAQEIFERARTDAWRKDGKSGFFFTVDYQGKPLVRQRFAWVVTEGVQATVALRRALLDEGAPEGEVEHYEHCYRSWIDFCEGYLIEEGGSWVGELNPNNEPDDTVWPGAPDVYHPFRALLAPRLPLIPTIPTALAHGLLDKADINAPTQPTKGWLARRS